MILLYGGKKEETGQENENIRYHLAIDKKTLKSKKQILIHFYTYEDKGVIKNQLPLYIQLEAIYHLLTRRSSLYDSKVSY